MYCYVGGKGSGKSYSCVQNVCLPAFRQGIPIITNIPLNVDLIRKDFIHADVLVIDDMTEQDIIQTPAGTLLIIDEIQLICGAAITYAKISPPLLEFFSKSRHKVDKGRAINIVIISQTLDGIGKPVKALVDTLYKCRKMSILGAANRYQIKQFEMSGGILVNKKPLTVANGIYQKKVYQYYSSNSQNVSDVEVVHIEEKLVKEKTIFNNRLVQFFILSPILVALLYYFFLSNIFDNLAGNSRPVPKTSISKKDSRKSDQSVIKPLPPSKNSKFFKIDSLYGFPTIHLNGMVINNIPYFSLVSKDKKINIDSISRLDLIKMGFAVKHLTNNLYLVNGNLVSFDKKIRDRSIGYKFISNHALPKLSEKDNLL
jgi:zona occludens toxin (predicted ATPase)